MERLTMNIVTCPNCGMVVTTLRIGRAATNIGITEACDNVPFPLVALAHWLPIFPHGVKAGFPAGVRYDGGMNGARISVCPTVGTGIK
jgi:hypothetical protein